MSNSLMLKLLTVLGLMSLSLQTEMREKYHRAREPFVASPEVGRAKPKVQNYGFFNRYMTNDFGYEIGTTADLNLGYDIPFFSEVPDLVS